MENKTGRRPNADDEGADRDATTDENGARPHKRNQALLKLLAGRWKCEIMLLLAGRTRRFGELRRELPGVTQHMLATQLRALEAGGLIDYWRILGRRRLSGEAGAQQYRKAPLSGEVRRLVPTTC